MSPINTIPSISIVHVNDKNELIPITERIKDNASPSNSDAPPIIPLNDRHNQSDSIVKEDYAG